MTNSFVHGLQDSNELREAGENGFYFDLFVQHVTILPAGQAKGDTGDILFDEGGQLTGRRRHDGLYFERLHDLTAGLEERVLVVDPAVVAAGDFLQGNLHARGSTNLPKDVLDLVGQLSDQARLLAT